MSTSVLPTDVDRRLVRLALPAFGALAAEPLFRLVDTAIVGRLGTAQLGGVAIAGSILSLVIAGSNFLAYGTTQRVAHRLGAGDRTGAADVGVQALWVAAAIGIVAAPILAILARPFCLAIGASADVVDYAVTYLRISALGVPFVVIGLAAQGAQRGASDYRSPLVVLLASNVANAVIEVILVFGFDFGVAGAAWSTVVAQAAAGVALVALSRPHVAAARGRRPLASEIRPLITAGKHLMLRVGAMLAVFTGATSLAARIDDPTLAAHSIVMTVLLFLTLSLDALAVPTQTLVAEEIGRSGTGAALVAERAVRLSLFAGIGLAVVVAALSPLISRFFSDDPAVVDRATIGLVLLALTLVPGSLAFATDGSLIGAGDYRFLGVAAVGYLIAVIPIAAVVVAVPSLGIVGIWAGLFVWMCLRAVVNMRRRNVVLGTTPIGAS